MDNATCDHCGHFKLDHQGITCQACFRTPPSKRRSPVTPAHDFRHTCVWTMAVVTKWSYTPDYNRDQYVPSYKNADEVLLLCACGYGKHVDP